jgi:hypothetical protein
VSYNSFHGSKAEIISETEAKKYIKSGSVEKKTIKDWYKESIQESQVSSWARLHRLGSAN